MKSKLKGKALDQIDHSRLCWHHRPVHKKTEAHMQSLAPSNLIKQAKAEYEIGTVRKIEPLF